MDFINNIFWNLVFGIRLNFVGGPGGSIVPNLDGGLDPETNVNPDPVEVTPVVTPVTPVQPVKPDPIFDVGPIPNPKNPQPEPQPEIISDDDFVGTEPG